VGRLPRGTGKKLRAWARWLEAADGLGPDDCKFCKRRRRSQAQCERCPEPALLPENLPAAELYLAASTQWNRSPMTGQRQGYDYPGLEAAARLSGIELDPELFERMRVLEHAAIEIDRQRTKPKPEKTRGKKP